MKAVHVHMHDNALARARAYLLRTHTNHCSPHALSRAQMHARTSVAGFSKKPIVRSSHDAFFFGFFSVEVDFVDGLTCLLSIPTLSPPTMRVRCATPPRGCWERRRRATPTPCPGTFKKQPNSSALSSSGAILSGSAELNLERVCTTNLSQNVMPKMVGAASKTGSRYDCFY